MLKANVTIRITRSVDRIGAYPCRFKYFNEDLMALGDNNVFATENVNQIACSDYTFIVLRSCGRVDVIETNGNVLKIGKSFFFMLKLLF